MSGSIKLCTYNILAAKYSPVMSFCAPRFLQWEYREPRLLDVLASQNADIYFLQEVEEPVYLSWQSIFRQKGFAGAHFMRDTGIVPGPPEGCMLLWNTAKFEHQHTHRFSFKSVLPPLSTPCPATEKAQAVKDGAVMCLLRHLGTNTHVLAVSVHLHWDPNWPDVKLLQASVLCQQVASFLSEHGLDPATAAVAIGGDFNSLWRKYRSDAFDKLPAGTPFITSGVYDLLSRGAVDTTHHDHPQQRRGTASIGDLDTASLLLQSAHMARHGREPTITTKTATFQGALDYIWLSRAAFRVVGTGAMPYQTSADMPGEADPEIVHFAPCPNEHQPSDHLPVSCEVVLV